MKSCMLYALLHHVFMCKVMHKKHYVTKNLWRVVMFLTCYLLNSLAVSLGFFDDIYVPVPLLFSPSRNEPVPGHK